MFTNKNVFVLKNNLFKCSKDVRKSMKKSKVLIVLIFLFANIFGNEKELLDFIGLKMSTEVIPAINGSRNFLGFSEMDDLSKIKIGSIMEVCKIPYSILDTCSDSISIPDILQSANKWYAPVLLDNKVKIFIEIKRINDSLNVVGYGMTFIADAWNSVL